VGFWLTFAAGVAVLAAAGHEMTAAWHLGPITGWQLWRVLVTSPEILVFLFFMITDPRTIPSSALGRRVYAVSVGFLAVLLIAPWTTEFAAKVAVLGALALVCAARPPLLALVGGDRVAAAAGGLRSRSRRERLGIGVLAAAAAGATLLVAGLPSHGSTSLAAPLVATSAAPEVTVDSSPGLQPIDGATAERIAQELVVALENAAEALRTRDRARASEGATGAWLAELWRTIDASRGSTIEVATYEVDRVRLALRPGEGQGPPLVAATLSGTTQVTTYGASPRDPLERADPRAVIRRFEVVQADGRYLVSAALGAAGRTPAAPAPAASFTLTDVAARVGLDFRHDAFRFGVSGDETAMMGGGLCWLDYDDDGWLDLYVVNTYADTQIVDWEARGGLPQSRLFRNVKGRFEDVTARSGAGLAVRGSGCVAADLDGNGTTDLLVTTSGYDVARDAYDALLWNDGDGTFTEGAWAAGIRSHGWHTGAAVADVNGDGRLDVFVAGYTDPNHQIAGSAAGFPANHEAVRDLLYLNVGGPGTHPRFREVGRAAGLEHGRLDHGLGASFVDVDRDGRLDLFVANDLDPNRLYRNVPRRGGRAADPRGLGFRFEERGREDGLDDPNAGMGVALGDYSGDGFEDLLVTNARGQLHAAHESRAGRPFADARPEFARALGHRLTGWGATWADLDLDGSLELAVVNGAIPVTSLEKNAERLQVATTAGAGLRLLDAGDVARRNGRGLAAADYDNDGDVDLAVGSIGGRLQLLRNDGASGHWLEVALRPFAPGTRVTVVLPDGRRLTRATRAGSSYLSSEDPRLHFGLGDADAVREVLVRSPGGALTRLRDIAADRLVVVEPRG
jgi:ASPIC and UnbV/FG-GAP-like repeat